tara:strand:+ start:192 stop:1220 length:1029 start_codon:yes stop_codon:yes gene_type:complete
MNVLRTHTSKQFQQLKTLIKKFPEHHYIFDAEPPHDKHIMMIAHALKLANSVTKIGVTLRSRDPAIAFTQLHHIEKNNLDITIKLVAGADYEEHSQRLGYTKDDIDAALQFFNLNIKTPITSRSYTETHDTFNALSALIPPERKIIATHNQKHWTANNNHHVAVLFGAHHSLANKKNQLGSIQQTSAYTPVRIQHISSNLVNQYTVRRILELSDPNSKLYKNLQTSPDLKANSLSYLIDMMNMLPDKEKTLPNLIHVGQPVTKWVENSIFTISENKVDQTIKDLNKLELAPYFNLLLDENPTQLTKQENLNHLNQFVSQLSSKYTDKKFYFALKASSLGLIN